MPHAMYLTVLIPHGITPTGVGISMGGGGYWIFATCPKCGGSFVYANQEDPDIKCEGDCQTVYRSFPGIGKENLLWAGPWKQCFKLEDGFTAWVERWTGLKGVAVVVDGEKVSI